MSPPSWSSRDPSVTAADGHHSSHELRAWLLEAQPRTDNDEGDDNINNNDGYDSDGQTIIATPRMQRRSSGFWRRRWRQRNPLNSPRWRWVQQALQRPPFRLLLRILKFALMFAFGSIATLLIFSNLDGGDGFDSAWQPFDLSGYDSGYPADYFRSVLPVPCHSHNDYWRRRPLYSALLTGCISVEADVWLVDGELYVGHSAWELATNNTLSSMYVQPLVDILEEMNKQTALTKVLVGSRNQQPKGVFYRSPKQTLNLLIDFKTAGPELFPYVMEALEPLRSRGWLTYWDGRARLTRPITVVGTGNTPFDMVVANETYRDIFFDAPLEALESSEDPPGVQDEGDVAFDAKSSRAVTHMYKYNPSNSHFASSSMQRALGPLWNFQFSNSQLSLMRSQIRQARDRGLLPRYWDTPEWPRGLRDRVWTVLLKERVGLLNVDDLRAVRHGVWGLWPQPER